MARPQKDGLDYFPLDVDIDHDDKVALVEAKHRILGFGILIKLLMKIYKNSYFYEWTEKEQLLFSKRVNVDINVINEVINDSTKWGFFDTYTLERYHVLTSRGIQKRYLEASKRRQRVELAREYLLLDEDELNVFKNVVIVDINQEKANINPQRKEKESKEKESKEKNYDDEIILQIKNLRSRYSEEQLKIIDEYLDILRFTRKNGKIAESVILKIYEEWEGFRPDTVEYALRVYIQNPNHHSKKENYCYGIMRNATPEEMEKFYRNKGGGQDGSKQPTNEQDSKTPRFDKSKFLATGGTGEPEDYGDLI